MNSPVRAAITGVGAAVPKKTLSNHDFEKFLDTSDEWIIQRTGIKNRQICSDGETTATLAAAAATEALERSNTRPDQLDLIICATVSPEMPFPATACFVQEAIGARGVAAFDVSAACSGFVYGLSVGSQFVETGKYKKVLVIGVDVLSKYTDYTDRGSCILFGDGGGAVVLEPTEEAGRGVLYSVLQADGAGWDYIHVPAGGTRQPASHETVEAHQHYISLRGRDVYKFAVDKMQWLLSDCMKQCDLTVDDVDLVVPHQVNTRIIQSATSKLNFPLEKVYMNIDRYGNTSAGSVPLALAEAVREGKLRRGQTALMVAFGAGLTWAGAVVRM